ncbi:MAG: hypothetical protein ACRD8W_23250, partial [Nitrososphaeraceae archaeon]
ENLVDEVSMQSTLGDQKSRISDTRISSVLESLGGSPAESRSSTATNDFDRTPENTMMTPGAAIDMQPQLSQHGMSNNADFQ